MRKLPGAAYKRPGEAALQKILVPPGKKFSNRSGQSKYIFTPAGSKLTQTGNLIAQWLIWPYERDDGAAQQLIFFRATSYLSLLQ
jgi:hypothetical protein